MIQRVFKTLGDNGCYFFCIWQLANRIDKSHYHDPFVLFSSSFDDGYIQADCFVNRPDKILEKAAGGIWEVRKEGPEYQPKENEYQVLRYERKTIQGILSHFVLQDWDPLGDSLTVKEGYIASKRIFKRIG